MKGIRYHKKKASILRPVRYIANKTPDALETAVTFYLGLAPITVPLTLIVLAGVIEKIFTAIF